jgi:hypothetical protein
MAQTQAEKAAALIVGPGGAVVFTALLAPVGCSDPSKILDNCPVGQKADILGWTLNGLVGTYDSAGIVIVAAIFALLAYLAVDMFTKKST